MTLFSNDGTWRKDVKPHVYNSSQWKEVQRAWVYSGGIWKQYFGAPAPVDWVTPSAGAHLDISSYSGEDIDIAMLDATHAIAVYASGGGLVGTAVCLTLSGTAVSAGTPLSFASEAGYGVSGLRICRMTDTTAICTFRSRNTGGSRAVLLTLSNTTVTNGTILSFIGGASASQPVPVCRITDTVAIACQTNSTPSVRAVALSVSGTNLSAGTDILAVNAGATWLSICAMTSTRAILAYKSATSTGKAICLSISDTTVSAGTAMTFESGTINANDEITSICRMTNTTAICTLGDVSANHKGYAYCLTLSDTTITSEAGVEYSSGTPFYIDVVAISTTQALVAYCRYSDYTYATLLNLGGTTITKGNEVKYDTNSADTWNSLTLMDNTHAIVAFNDTSSSAQVTACCISGENSNTVLLLHCNGTDGASSFVDSSPAARTITAYIGASDYPKTMATPKKFGDAAGKFFSSSPSYWGYLGIGGDAITFGTGDFTIEWQNYFHSAAGSYYNMVFDRNGDFRVYFIGTSTLYCGGISFSTSLSTETWYHIALTRASGSLRLFVNGSQVGTTQSDTSNWNSTNPLYVGTAYNQTQIFYGSLDEIRVSNVARWTSNFTAPTAEYE